MRTSSEALRVTIAAPPSQVFAALTDPEAMRVWMGEPAMDVVVELEPRVGGRIVVTATHGLRSSSHGRVLALEAPWRFAFTHRAEISRLPDLPESDTTLDFRVEPRGASTELTLLLSGFPTEAIEKHLLLYWRGTLPFLAAHVEQRRER